MFLFFSPTFININNSKGKATRTRHCIWMEEQFFFFFNIRTLAARVGVCFFLAYTKSLHL